MFDPVTAALLRSAPAVEGLDANDIPQILTEHYASLVADRLTGAAVERGNDVWPIDRIASTYELITSVHDEPVMRRAAAFVAGTAHQIISRREPTDGEPSPPWTITRDAVEPTVAAALLFLAAEQYADAQEAAVRIRTDRDTQPYETQILAEHIRDLASGKLNQILERAERWRRPARRFPDIQTEAFIILIDTLIEGLEQLASAILGGADADNAATSFSSARNAFKAVMARSTTDAPFAEIFDGHLFTSYSGPRHMASLLLAVQDGIAEASLTSIPPPSGASADYWRRWLSFRANKFPFVWRNHREALAKNFHETGNSAVLVLPTGAGKTTVSSLKIAGVLARGKKVIFLAPTHTLVEQLTDDLQELFPKELLGASVSSDFDLLLLQLSQFNEIEVMTPERCLAMLSFAPEAFEDVGLFVFDECHLLSPQSGKIRRALDSMLCLLAFNSLAPDADLLFLSAMLKNGEEFGSWISHLVGRPCIHVDLLWKPSRQARGVVIYKTADLDAAMKAATTKQNAIDKAKGEKAKGLRSASKKLLLAKPFAIWGLQHNWLSAGSAICSITPLSNEQFLLGSSYKYRRLRLTPNANNVAGKVAISAARGGLKTIVFVNTRDDAVTVANAVAVGGTAPIATEFESARFEALRVEFGDLKHTLVGAPAFAVPHHSGMLRLERVLAEHLFKRPDGAQVIVATPTLAQGLNLPAQLAVLAGDKRSGDKGKREDLEAHELLNAAARAGRAGHLANGVVLLIPEPVISYAEDEPLDADVVEKLSAIVPEDDRCVVISDPLEVVLDRIMLGDSVDPDVRYTVNRMAALSSVDGAPATGSLFRLDRSLAAFVARKANATAEFETRLTELRKSVDGALPAGTSEIVKVLSSRSGLPAALLNSLRAKVMSEASSLPTTMVEWIDWLFAWLLAEKDAIGELFFDAESALAASTGLPKAKAISKEALAAIQPGVIAWMNGKPFCEIEVILGGDPNDGEILCPRSRALALSILPRGISFLAGLLTTIVRDIPVADGEAALLTDVVTNLSTAVRKGFDSTEKLVFANQNSTILSRVQAHKAWDNRAEMLFSS